MTTFTDLGLSKDILKALDEKGYREPTPIQARAIPVVLDGYDLLAAAQTGTGKTAGFTLPITHVLSQDKIKGKRPVRALILTPTRELAAQIQENIIKYSKYLDLTSAVIFGGVNARPQAAQLRQGVDILVATPGRLLDLCGQGVCKLDKVEMLVLDEADRMLDMGFVNEMRKIVKLLPKQRQNLLFSATFSKEIKSLTREFLVNPKTVEVATQNATADRVSQRAYRCDNADKPAITVKLIKDGKWEQVLIFTRTKHGANRLAKRLADSGINSAAIHGNKSQGARVKALEGFKEKKVRALVATDIAARGIDISLLPHVINYELPNVPADYVHRIGRTARAGMEGEAVSLVSNEERAFFQDIEKLIKQKIELEDVDGFDPQEWSFKAPTANDVQKARAVRQKEAMANRGPRRDKPRRDGGKPKAKAKGGSGNAGGSRDGRRPAAKKSSANRSRNRRPRRSE